MKKRLVSLLLTAAMLTALLPAGWLPAAAEPAMSAPASLLVLGDSIAAGYMYLDGQNGGEARDHCYGYLLARSLGLTENVSYFNQAVSGHTTAKCLEVVQGLPTDMGAPDLIALSIGGNDVQSDLRADASANLVNSKPELEAFLANPDQARIDAVQARQNELGSDAGYLAKIDAAGNNVSDIFTALSQKFPTSRIVIQTVYDPVDWSDDFCIELPVIDKLNAKIREVAASFSQVTVLDVAAGFAGKGSQYIDLDLIHPNAAGHGAIADMYRALWTDETADPTLVTLADPNGTFVTKEGERVLAMGSGEGMDWDRGAIASAFGWTSRTGLDVTVTVEYDWDRKDGGNWWWFNMNDGNGESAPGKTNGNAHDNGFGTLDGDYALTPGKWQVQQFTFTDRGLGTGSKDFNITCNNMGSSKMYIRGIRFDFTDGTDTYTALWGSFAKPLADLLGAPFDENDYEQDAALTAFYSVYAEASALAADGAATQRQKADMAVRLLTAFDALTSKNILSGSRNAVLSVGNYLNLSGCQNEGSNFGFIGNGSYIEYEIVVKTAGWYTATFTSSSNENGDGANGDGYHKHLLVGSPTPVQLNADNSEVAIYTAAAIPPLGGWGNYADVTAEKPFYLSAGTQKIYVYFTSGNTNFRRVELRWQDSQSGGIDLGVSTRIDAAHYDGFEGRSENIRLENGYNNFGYTYGGAHIDFKVNVLQAGMYDFTFVASTNNDNNHIELRNGSDTVLGSTDAITKQGWGTYAPVTAEGVQLQAGLQTLRVYIANGGVNLRYMTAVRGEDGLSSENPVSLTSRNYVEYSEGLSLENGGSNFGNCNGDRYVKYTLNVKEAGYYTATFECANNEANPYAVQILTPSIENLNAADGSGLYTAAFVPVTGGWQVYDFFKGNKSFYLNEGVQDVYVLFGGGSNYRKTEIAWAADQSGYIGLTDGTVLYWADFAEKSSEEPKTGDGKRAFEYFNAGKWADYKVNVSAGGYYDFAFMLSTGNDNAKLELQDGAGNSYGATETVVKQGWNTFETYTVPGVKLAAGQQILRLVSPNDYVNFRFVTVTRSAPVNPGVTGRSITLEGDIGVNLYLEIPAAFDTAGAYVTLDGVKTLLEDLPHSGTTYKVTARVVAKEMDKRVALKLFNGSDEAQMLDVYVGDSLTDTVEEYLYSVNDYIDGAMADPEFLAANPNLAVLLDAMRTYGAYSKKYFLEPDLAAPSLDVEIPGAGGITYGGFAAGELTGREDALPVGSVTGLTYYGSSLILEAETTLRHYFLLEGDPADYVFSLGEQTLTSSLRNIEGTRYYYVAIPNIAAKDLDTDYTLTVTKGGETCTLTYSAMDYCKKAVQDTAHPGLADLAKAIFLYNYAANGYFGG